MAQYIALFRGINVGGNSILPMKTLVAILEELGARGVKTYIQSGNAVFQSGAEDLALLAEKISDAVNQRCGFAPRVLILTLADLGNAIAENPFSVDASDPAALHLGFLASPPQAPDLEKLESLRAPSEQFHLTERVFYLFAPEGVGRSKLAAASEKLLGVPMTDRNWKTVRKIRELAGE